MANIDRAIAESQANYAEAARIEAEFEKEIRDRKAKFEAEFEAFFASPDVHPAIKSHCSSVIDEVTAQIRARADREIEEATRRIFANCKVTAKWAKESKTVFGKDAK